MHIVIYLAIRIKSCNTVSLKLSNSGIITIKLFCKLSDFLRLFILFLTLVSIEYFLAYHEFNSENVHKDFLIILCSFSSS